MQEVNQRDALPAERESMADRFKKARQDIRHKMIAKELAAIDAALHAIGGNPSQPVLPQ